MTSTTPLQASDEWDAGHIGCGELLVKLHLRLRVLQPRQLFRLVALDPAAPEELPAWCRLTGHTLVSTRHPEYWIQRKEH
jgi:tRNA 2-thiouridine synthesizing protein A